MKKTIAILSAIAALTLLSFNYPPQKAESIMIEVIAPEPTFKEVLASSTLPVRREMVRVKVAEFTKKYKIENRTEQIYQTIASCENIPLDSNLQSGHRYKVDNLRWGVKAGEQERSFGLAMIHLPDHPDISYEEATSPLFAIEWMVKEFSLGRSWQWTCYTSIYE